jgi:hypothetical protein
MKEEKKIKIEQLAATAHDKSEKYKMLGMMNTPSEPEAKKQSAIEYAVARGEMIEANRELEDALNLVITPGINPKTRHRIENVLEEDGYKVIGGGQFVNLSRSDISFERDDPRDKDSDK